MATRFVLQRDKRSNNTFGYQTSDTEVSALLSVATNAPIVVPDGAHLARIAASGSTVYVGIDAVPVIPVGASFVAQVGHQVNNGAVDLLSVEPGQTINVISIDICSVQISFYENESVQ